jgi:hypothetical protein
MNIDLIKNTPLSYVLQFLDFLDICLKTNPVGVEWKDVVISPIHMNSAFIEA